jgi:carbonic anhydrase
MAIIECMDSRIDTFAALGLQIGDAHIIRNGGGLITEDVLRSLAISQRALGTQAVMIMHHTDCGMHGFDDTAFRAELAAESGQEPTWDVPGFTDIEGKIRESVAAVRNCSWILHRNDVRGFVYDVQTGKITEVE